MGNQPMAEVFGFRVDDLSSEAERHRQNRLCPFNNKVPSCTKDKAKDPLGVCSIYEGDQIAIICPIRFRENWHIVTDAAAFFFPAGSLWTSLTEIRLSDKNGKSAGNIDFVLVSYDQQGQITDFGALEVQAVYISGNIRKPFTHYIKDPANHASMDWSKQPEYPRADYLSSSRKRLAPQLIYKGGILHSWGKKMAVAIDKGFLAELPTLPQVDVLQADLAWFVYDLHHNDRTNRYQLTLVQTIYTQFTPALQRIIIAEPGSEADFRKLLQRKLAEQKIGAILPSDTFTLPDVLKPDVVSEE